MRALKFWATTNSFPDFYCTLRFELVPKWHCSNAQSGNLPACIAIKLADATVIVSVELLFIVLQLENVQGEIATHPQTTFSFYDSQRWT